jgi:hypothetical protein
MLKGKTYLDDDEFCLCPMMIGLFDLCQWFEMVGEFAQL